MTHAVLATLSAAALVTVYNNLATIVDATDVKKFADKVKGAARVAKMLDRVNEYRTSEALPLIALSDDGKLVVVEPPVVEAPAPVEPVAPVVAAPAPVVKTGKIAKKAPGRTASVSPTDVILVNVSENPKFGTAADRFANYVTGRTVAEYITALGGDRKQALRDIAWDRRQKWVEVVAPKSAAAKAARAAVAAAQTEADEEPLPQEAAAPVGDQLLLTYQPAQA